MRHSGVGHPVNAAVYLLYSVAEMHQLVFVFTERRAFT